MAKTLEKQIRACYYTDYVDWSVTMAKILVTMPDEFLHKIDGFASNEQRTRSELIREALRTYMRRSNVVNPQKAQKNAEYLENLIG